DIGITLNDKSCAVRHKIWVENMNVSVIPSRMGRDIFLTCFFYPYLIPNGILANSFVIVHSRVGRNKTTQA
ncbi:MAG: hypothetical protein QX196_04480, partial [Methylococcaceae bacterium]